MIQSRLNSSPYFGEQVSHAEEIQVLTAKVEGADTVCDIERHRAAIWIYVLRQRSRQASVITGESLIDGDDCASVGWVGRGIP